MFKVNNKFLKTNFLAFFKDFCVQSWIYVRYAQSMSNNVYKYHNLALNIFEFKTNLHYKMLFSLIKLFKLMCKVTRHGGGERAVPNVDNSWGSSKISHQLAAVLHQIHERTASRNEGGIEENIRHNHTGLLGLLLN